MTDTELCPFGTGRLAAYPRQLVPPIRAGLPLRYATESLKDQEITRGWQGAAALRKAMGQLHGQWGNNNDSTKGNVPLLDKAEQVLYPMRGITLITADEPPPMPTDRAFVDEDGNPVENHMPAARRAWDREWRAGVYLTEDAPTRVFYAMYRAAQLLLCDYAPLVWARHTPLHRAPDLPRYPDGGLAPAMFFCTYAGLPQADEHGETLEAVGDATTEILLHLSSLGRVVLLWPYPQLVYDEYHEFHDIGAVYNILLDRTTHVTPLGGVKP